MLTLAIFPVFADELVEFRGAPNASYRYADWSHSFKNKLATDMYYVGVPGNNEADACVGYSLPAFKGLSATPFFCGLAAKEDRELGVKAAAVLAWEKGKFKADAYYAHFVPLRGSIKAYDLLDAGNATYSATKRWEVGASVGFFRQDRSWNPLAGPLVRRNDKTGFWAVSFRTGAGNELRFIRVFNIRR